MLLPTITCGESALFQLLLPQHIQYASKAVARDFDRDGALDIVSIAFYDEPEEQEQTFLYLENKRQQDFFPASTPVAAHGKWITMEACDFDRDGNDAIIPGSFVYSVGELTKLLNKGI